MSDVDSFMNPYTQQVIDPVLRDIEQSRAMQQQANASRALAAGLTLLIPDKLDLMFP